jgi:hypothetical protein
MAKLKLPKDCLKSDVCKFVGDNGCLNGCDYRLERSDNSDYAKCAEDLQEMCQYGASQSDIMHYLQTHFS